MEQLVIGDDVRREGVLVELLDCEGLRVKMSVGYINGEKTKQKRQRRINRERRRTFSMVFQSVQKWPYTAHRAVVRSVSSY